MRSIWRRRAKKSRVDTHDGATFPFARKVLSRSLEIEAVQSRVLYGLGDHSYFASAFLFSLNRLPLYRRLRRESDKISSSRVSSEKELDYMAIDERFIVSYVRRLRADYGSRKCTEVDAPHTSTDRHHCKSKTYNYFLLKSISRDNPRECKRRHAKSCEKKNWEKSLK